MYKQALHVCIPTQKHIIEFSIIPIFWPNPDRILPALTEREQNKKLPQSGLKPQPADLHSNALPTELSQHSVASLNLHGLYKVHALLIPEIIKVHMVKWYMKQTKLTSKSAQQIPA